MKQNRHIDIDAMLRNLPQEADNAMSGLEATPFLKARINRAAAQQQQNKIRFALPKWAPALCCAALVLVAALTFVPTQQAQPGTLINSAMLGPTEAPASVLSADLRSGDVFITSGSTKPGYRNIWSEVQDGSFPLIGLSGKYYRMLTNPSEVNRELLDGQVASIDEFTTEPSLSGTDVALSNVAVSGTAVYAIKDVPSSTLIAAEVNGHLRLFQRVSFNGNALRGKEVLADTLTIAGKVVAMELTGIGTVTDPAACEQLLATLMTYAGYDASGSITSKKALLIELDNGLVLQMNVKGDKLAACGVWSCPEFFEAFDEACD